MKQLNFPVNEAKPLIKIPKVIPQIGFLGGEQGEEIDVSIKTDYKDFSVMQIGNYFGGIVRGSNSFYVVGVQSKLSVGVRVANQADLETAIRTDALDLSRTYEDTGLVLRTDGYPNLYLAGNLMKQVQERLGKKTKMPVMIPFCGMEIVKDQDSPYGLAFNLKENAEVHYAPILNKSKGSNFTFQNIDVKTGLPIGVGNGNRTLCIRNSGLSKLCLGGVLHLDSGDGGLANSDYDHRVVLISTAESESQILTDSRNANQGGSQPVLDSKLTELQLERDAEISGINERYSSMYIVKLIDLFA